MENSAKMLLVLAIYQGKILIDLLFVALIISAGCSEGHVARRLQQAHFSVPILHQILGFRIRLEPESKKFGINLEVESRSKNVPVRGKLIS